MCTCSNVKYLTNNQSDTCHFKYKNCNNKLVLSTHEYTLYNLFFDLTYS